MFLLQAADPAAFNWPTVIASVLGGGLISSVISFITARKLKEAEFDYDYRKYILQRRKTAYEDLEKMIGGLRAGQPAIFEFADDGKGNSIVTNAPAIGRKQDHYSSLVKLAGTYQLWFTHQLNTDLVLLELNLPQNGNPIWQNRKEEDAIKLHGILNDLTDQYFADIVELDDIKKFKAEKKK